MTVTQGQVDTFLDEFEALCEKHKLTLSVDVGDAVALIGGFRADDLEWVREAVIRTRKTPIRQWSTRNMVATLAVSPMNSVQGGMGVMATAVSSIPGSIYPPSPGGLSPDDDDAGRILIDNGIQQSRPTKPRSVQPDLLRQPPTEFPG